MSELPPPGVSASPTPPRGPLRVQRVALSALAPDPANARLHGAANLDAIKATLRRFGQAEPLVVQAGTRRVIAGHGRLVAIQAQGWAEADEVELEVSGTDATALGIALNRTAELAEWDGGTLSRILEQHRAEDALDNVGYSPGNLDALMDEFQRTAGEAPAGADEALRAAREKLASLKARAIDEADLRAALETFEVWPVLFPNEQARVLRLLVERIDLDPDTGTIELRLHPGGVRELARRGETVA